jgi:cyanophycinase-like exopeptidase
VRAVKEARGIFIGGGNTFRLLNDLYRHGLLEPIRERVRAGVPYLGISAGGNVPCTLAFIAPSTFSSMSAFFAFGAVTFRHDLRIVSEGLADGYDRSRFRRHAGVAARGQGGQSAGI